MLSILGFTAPHIDYHALAPEIIIAATLIVVLLVDHDDFDLGMIQANAKYVLDTRRCLGAAPNVEHL